MLNISIIGYGYWGTKLARNFHGSELFELTTIVDKKAGNLKIAKRKYPSSDIYKD